METNEKKDATDDTRDLLADALSDLPVAGGQAEATRGGIVVAGGAGPHVKVIDGTRLG